MRPSLSTLAKWLAYSLVLGSLNLHTASANTCEQVGLSACPNPIDSAIPAPKDMLNWDQATRVIGFRNTFRMYDGDAFKTLGATPYPLPPAKSPMPPISYKLDGVDMDLNDFLKNQNVNGLLILKKGEVVYEHYDQGNTPETLWTSRSVAKSVVSVLIGAAIQQGKIKSVHDPITQYIPELVGTAWDGVTLEQILQHTSGVKWNEDYADPNSDFSHMTLCEAKPDPFDCLFNLVKSVERKPDVQPGQIWSYNTGGAWLVGLVLERATGTTIAQYLQDRIWSQFAMEHDGVWHALIRGKVNMGGHGFNASLRDWGRFGLFALKNGKLADGTQILPDNWMQQSTNWTTAKGSMTSYAPKGQYGYQWWFNGVDPKQNTEPKTTATSDDTYWAFGIYGQTIAINPTEDLVVVQWSTWKNAETPQSLYDEQMVFVNAVSNALR